MNIESDFHNSKKISKEIVKSHLFKRKKTGSKHSRKQKNRTKNTKE